MTISHGLSGLGANSPSDTDISRADARPDFTKIEATWQRSQYLSTNWMIIGTLTGQRASRALYSSEEFGFGGPFLGRAYDASEITGDHGLGGALEARYTGVSPVQGIQFIPSLFYDIGKVWNIDSGQDGTLSVADAGIGMTLSHSSGLNGTLTIAQPLTKPVNTPHYGNNGDNPRIYLQVKWDF